MRSSKLWFAGLFAVSLGAAGATMVACGDDSSGTTSGGDDGGTTDATTGDGGGGGNDTGTSGDTGGQTDGNGGQDAGDSGPFDGAPTPAQIECGNVACSASTQECCQYADAGSSAWSCIANDAGFGACPGITATCDEAADCLGDSGVCCLGASSGGFGASCSAAPCFVQVCKTNAECGDAGTCSKKSCFGRQLQVCGSPLGCQ